MNDQANPQSLISSEVEVTGTIKTSGSIRIDGKLDGELHAAGDVVIGKSAAIKGNLIVNSIAVEGSIQGNIIAKDKIALKATARLLGDIKAKRLSVEDGVTFIGKSEVNPSGSPAPEKKAPAVGGPEGNKPQPPKDGPNR